MEATELVWGIILIGAGIFLAVYGQLLFKFALLAMGFAVGMAGAWWLFEDQEDLTRFLIAMVVGAAVGLLLFSMVKFGLYIAGAMLGLVIAVLISGVIDIIGSTPSDTVVAILVIGGLAGGGIFGHRIGSLAILFATSAMGALLVVDGLSVLFESRIGGNVDDVTATLAQRLTLAVFVVILAISALSQWTSRNLRQRVVN